MKYIRGLFDSARRMIEAHRRGLFYVVCPKCKTKTRVDELTHGKFGEYCPCCKAAVIFKFNPDTV